MDLGDNFARSQQTGSQKPEVIRGVQDQTEGLVEVLLAELPQDEVSAESATSLSPRFRLTARLE